MWEGLNPPYKTIVADPPWRYDEGWPEFGDRAGIEHKRRSLPYSGMSLLDAFDVLAAWGFRYSQTLAWCKPPMGIGPGGAYANTTEYVLHGRRGTLPALRREPTTWWEWPRRAHSVKPPEFFDLVERVSPGPYVELFARQPRLGWDHWGWGYEPGVRTVDVNTGGRT